MGGERIIEMTWRCSGCKRQNLGRYKSCQWYGNPKDASEEFEMPANTALAPTVTDPNLLRMAMARPAAQAASARKPVSVWVVLFGLLAFTYSGCWAVVWLNEPYTATVTSATWEHVIDVERYAIRPHEGFKEAIPADASDGKSLGKRFHHNDQEVIGYETQTFVDTKPDGTSLQTYSVREVCGEDCTTEPERCREVCTSNSNGFATCRQVCSGGRTRCKPRYCSGTRTREVPQTRSEVVKIRVPKYREVPRYAEFFSYKMRSWAHDRTEREQGVLADQVEAGGPKLKWPAGARTSGLPPGEQEREKRTAHYLVTIQYGNGVLIRFEETNPAWFARYPQGSTHKLRIERDMHLLNNGRITPLNLR